MKRKIIATVCILFLVIVLICVFVFASNNKNNKYNIDINEIKYDKLDIFEGTIVSADDFSVEADDRIYADGIVEIHINSVITMPSHMIDENILVYTGSSVGRGSKGKYTNEHLESGVSGIFMLHELNDEERYDYIGRKYPRVTDVRYIFLDPQNYTIIKEKKMIYNADLFDMISENDSLGEIGRKLKHIRFPFKPYNIRSISVDFDDYKYQKLTNQLEIENVISIFRKYTGGAIPYTFMDGATSDVSILVEYEDGEIAELYIGDEGIYSTNGRYRCDNIGGLETEIKNTLSVKRS